MRVDTYVEIASNGPHVEFNDFAAKCSFSADKEPREKAHVSRVPKVALKEANICLPKTAILFIVTKRPQVIDILLLTTERTPFANCFQKRGLLY